MARPIAASRGGRRLHDDPTCTGAPRARTSSRDEERGSDLLRLGGDDEFSGSVGDAGLYFDGGDGNDVIDGSSSNFVRVVGGAGHDRIRASAESVDVAAGAGDDRVTTGSEDGVVRGGDGADLLDVLFFASGGGLVDGGAGGRHPGHRRPAGSGQRALGGSGDDRIGVRPTSPDGTVHQGIDANGGDGRDVLTGSDHPDAELGGDLLYGGAGNDRISGRRGDDKLGGDGGVDTLSGGAGRDIFDFNPGGSGVGAGRRDIITDFVRGQDVLDLLSVDANAGRAGDQAFSFVGTRAFTGAGQVRLARVDGDTVVQASTNGDRAPELEILLANGAAPAAGDFLL
jgi:Ca2+-binding RTX toxin-like protein